VQDAAARGSREPQGRFAVNGDQDWEVFLLNLATEGGRAVDAGPNSGT
jgi:hypothetical protein